ncbi:XdhC family protein [Luteimonas sp. RIT-PG2_3]
MTPAQGVVSALPPGGARAVFDALRRATPAQRDGAVLGIVMGTEGSTYAKAGALLGFGPGELRQGWISGGCLEPVLEQEAAEVAATRRARIVALDTRDDGDLMFGSRVGCRGLLHVALLPVATMPALETLLSAWRAQAGALEVAIEADGARMRCGEHAHAWPLAWASSATADVDGMTGPAGQPSRGWALSIPPARWARIYGAGPESPWLLPGLRSLGAHVALVERRPRWKDAGVFADAWHEVTPATVAWPAIDASVLAAGTIAIVQHHDFELDREALLALAATPVPWIGLLGPMRRRDELLRLLPEPVQASLLPRVHGPVGLDLGGQGPEVIALSICAQLQQYWSRR